MAKESAIGALKGGGLGFLLKVVFPVGVEDFMEGGSRIALLGLSRQERDDEKQTDVLVVKHCHGFTLQRRVSEPLV